MLFFIFWNKLVLVMNNLNFYYLDIDWIEKVY